MAADGEDGDRSPAARCEACGLNCKDSADLAVHQERHRPVDPPIFHPDTGIEVSYPCPEGCGRNFTAMVRYKDHIPLCDGQPPMDPVLKNVPTGYHEGIIICPECAEPFKDLGKMALHLERHREVHPELRHRRTGEMLSQACPKKCGRNFPHWREYEEHLQLCDGQPPLPGNRAEGEAMERNLHSKRLKRRQGDRKMPRCGECEMDFKKARLFEIHMRKIHEKPNQKAKERGSDKSGDKAKALLRDKSRDLRRKADRLEEIVKMIERLYKEAEDLI